MQHSVRELAGVARALSPHKLVEVDRLEVSNTLHALPPCSLMRVCVLPCLHTAELALVHGPRERDEQTEQSQGIELETFLRQLETSARASEKVPSSTRCATPADHVQGFPKDTGSCLS